MKVIKFYIRIIQIVVNNDFTIEQLLKHWTVFNVRETIEYTIRFSKLWTNHLESLNLAEESGENKEENSNVSAGMLTRHEAKQRDGGTMILVPFHHPESLVSFLFDKGQVIFHCYWRRRGMCSITCDKVCLR